MATMFGRFEVQSELSKSETAQIYKALDTETNQVVALKTQSLEPLGERAAAFVETLIAEGESTRDLAGQNIAMLYGAGEIDGQFCAAMEYIQGNSIATMLARKEGFSIWDLLDITRQVCSGLEHAAAKNVAHCSLEPDKILVQWDGMVKILGYGISNMSLIEAESGKGLGRMMPYCSPEQLRGEAIDLRSNLFTVGTILYEMVVGRKAFDAADPGTLLTRIENEMPASPSEVNAKIQPAVSALIMKALAKDPAERYQSARALLEDLENCKENGKKAAVEPKKKTTTATKIVVDPAARAAAASKFVSANAGAKPAAPTASPKPVAQVSPNPAPKPAASRPAPASSALSNPVSPRANVPVPSPARPAVETRAAAAAAGATTGGGAYSVSQLNAKAKPSDATSKNSTSGARLISDFEVSSSASQSAASPAMSAAAPIIEPEPAPTAPRVPVDPMMAAPANASSGTSFSDLEELPPLKEKVISTSFAEPEAPLPAELLIQPKKKEEKPKVEVRQAAQKAMQEIATVPPRLMIYSILGAVALILVVVVALFFHVRSEDDGSTAAPRPTKVAEAKPAPPVAQPPVTARAETPVPPIAEPQPDLNVRQVEKVEKRAVKVTRRAPAPAPVVIPGQALIDSNPQGAQFQVDGKSDPSWITPFSLINLAPGKHIISISKAGYSSDIRSVEVAAGSKSSLVLHLSAINALIAANSTPPGAEVIIDGKPTGRVTPAQFAVEKGSHTIFLRKQGYLDETTVADLGPAQNFQYSPVLRALGNTEDMRALGKFNKLFGRGGEGAAGMGSIMIRTQPKGAQVAINQRILDKTSPAGVAVEPGNYIVDITMTGFKPIHKVINLEKGGKAVIDEVLERQ
jgi:serine/threonine protein kinase